MCLAMRVNTGFDASKAISSNAIAYDSKSGRTEIRLARYHEELRFDPVSAYSFRTTQRFPKT